MDFQERLNLPRRLSWRLWLITLPSAIVSFERRSEIPKLPATGSRALGALLLLAGAALGIFAARQPDTPLAYEGPLAPVVRQPATLAGLVALGGAAFALRSSALLLYVLGLVLAGGAGRIELDEPEPRHLLDLD